MSSDRRRVAASLAALAVLVGACSSDDGAQAEAGRQPVASDDIEDVDDPAPDPDTDFDPSPEPDPAPDPDPDPDPDLASEPEPEPHIDITVIPDEITDEYVAAVLVELERIYAEAYAIVRDEQELTSEITDRVDAIFAESRREDRYDEFRQLAGMPEVFRPQGELQPRTRQVVEILDAADGCLWVETLTDSSGLSPSEGQQTVFVALFHKDAGRPGDVNPTPWVFERLRTPVEAGSDEAARDELLCAGF